MTKLNIEKILDYYDRPQLFVARDGFDTLYLCLLYDDCEEPRYTAIRISPKKLNAFLAGGLDLRAVMAKPETAGEYFDVAERHGTYTIAATLSGEIPDDRLPGQGYTMSADESENFTVNVPLRDRNLFQDLIHKFGWACM